MRRSALTPLLLLLTVAEVARANIFAPFDVDSILQLEKTAQSLHHDITTAMRALQHNRDRDQFNCLTDLENLVVPIDDSLDLAYELVLISSEMRDRTDEMLVNHNLAKNLPIMIEFISGEREHALALAAGCSDSDSVSNYAQKAADLAGRSVQLLGSIEARLSGISPHR